MNCFERTFKGLALGECHCWTSLYQRSFLLPSWTRRKRREIDAQYEIEGLLEISLPFALNQPTDTFKPGPGPHSEWFIFQMQVLLEGNGSYSLECALDCWRNIALSSLRLSISERAALTNLRAGKSPPFTGYDNPHYFDDAACFRALAIACIYADDLPTALQVVAQDASITNAEDGLWGAQAVAAATVMAAQGASVDICLETAVRQLPQGSWIHMVMERALAHASESQGVFDLIMSLSRDIVNDSYNYGNAAAETIPLACAILKSTQGNPEQALLAALAIPRTAGSVAPLVGALCGTLGHLETDVHDNLVSAPLRGIALPNLAGITLAGKLQELTAAPTR